MSETCRPSEFSVLCKHKNEHGLPSTVNVLRYPYVHWSIKRGGVRAAVEGKNSLDGEIGILLFRTFSIVDSGGSSLKLSAPTRKFGRFAIFFPAAEYIL